MVTRRRLRKEDQEQRNRRKKELRKSYEKTRPGSKSVGAKRLSDTQKYLLVGSVAVAIIIIITVQFLIPPTPTCYYTESDYVIASLDQTSQKVSFNHIVAQYIIRPERTKINCDITDYFNSSYTITPPTQPTHTPPPYVSSITYSLADLESPLIWACPMNGTPLPMTNWINTSTMTISPTSIKRNTPTQIRFRLSITTQIHLDRCNISLKFIQNTINTTLAFFQLYNGTEYFNINRTILTQKTNVTAKSTLLLDFILTITTSQPPSKLNLLEVGAINLVKNNQLLQSYLGASAFKESLITFKGLGLGGEPSLKKSKFLDVMVNIPCYNITVTN